MLQIIGMADGPRATPKLALLACAITGVKEVTHTNTLCLWPSVVAFFSSFSVPFENFCMLLLNTAAGALGNL